MGETEPQEAAQRLAPLKLPCRSAMAPQETLRKRWPFSPPAISSPDKSSRSTADSACNELHPQTWVRHVSLLRHGKATNARRTEDCLPRKQTTPESLAFGSCRVFSAHVVPLPFTIGAGLELQGHLLPKPDRLWLHRPLRALHGRLRIAGIHRALSLRPPSRPRSRSPSSSAADATRDDVRRSPESGIQLRSNSPSAKAFAIFPNRP